jgi:NADH-quinone oxidoreductase subunit M
MTTDVSIILPLLVAIPLICGFGLVLLPRGRADITRTMALGISGVVFALSVVVCFAFDWSQPQAMQFGHPISWIGDFGVRFHFAVDSISLWLVMLTTFLVPLTILGSFSAVKERATEFFLWLLVLEASMIGVFLARDLILFYVFFELSLVPLYFLIGIFGSANRRWASIKFFIFTFTGSVLTFAGVLYVAHFNTTLPASSFMGAGEWTFDITTLYQAALALSPTQQAWILGALMAGFAVKVPLFPVHTWLPLAHTEAPTAGSVLLAGVSLKLGTYALLRFALPMAPEAVVAYAPLIAGFAIAGILYAALVCWVQDDVKKLVAYSSVSHLGFCVLGMFALNVAGVGGSIMYMINHGLSTGALFLCVGMIYERYHTRDMNQMSGLGRRLPIWGSFFVFFCLASVGLPGLNGFVGEFLTLLGAYAATDLLGIGYVVVAALGLILAAIYILYMVGRVVMGPVKEPDTHGEPVKDLNSREIAMLAPIAVMCVVLGLFPTPWLKSLEPAIDEVIKPAVAVMQQQADAEATAWVAPSPQPSPWKGEGVVEVSR